MDWGVKREVAEFIFESVDRGNATLETGCGISTLVFAIKKSIHTAVTPSREEVETISRYANTHSISLDTVSFVNEPSEDYLPRAVGAGPLDLVLIDGRHAFPWPEIDYFYTAPRIKKGGVIIVDDIMIPSVGVLVEFMGGDANWKVTREFPRHALAFTKVGNELNVEWNFQRYNKDYWKKIRRRPNIVKRVVRKSKRIIKGEGA